MRPLALTVLLVVAVSAGGMAADIRSNPADALVRDALAAEAKHDTQRALELFLAAEKAGGANALLLQKIARQYSDLTLDLPSRDDQRAAAEHALAYARRAVALEPTNAVNVLSVAISHGRLAIASDTRDKVRFSRLVREDAERALALDPNYAWAHHILGRWHLEVAALGATSRTFVKLFYGGLPPATVQEAVVHLQRAAELEPDELQHHLELGHGLLAAGDVTQGHAALSRGLALPSRAKHDEPAKARARNTLEKLPRA